MTYSPLQLEAIKLFGKKDLTFGCIVSEGGDTYQIFNFSSSYKNARYWDDKDEEVMMVMKGGYKILGHIPHLEDLFRVAEEKGKVVEVRNVCYSRIELFTKDNPFPLCVPYNPTLPLLLQPEDTLTQLCNLFK